MAQQVIFREAKSVKDGEGSGVDPRMRDRVGDSLLQIQLDELFLDRRGDRFAMLFEADEIAFHGIANVRKGFVAGGALRDAPRQVGAFRNEDSVFILLNQYSKSKGNAKSISRSEGQRQHKLSGCISYGGLADCYGGSKIISVSARVFLRWIRLTVSRMCFRTTRFS